MQQQGPRPIAEAPAPHVVTLPQAGTPMTGEEVKALRIRINDLREELQDAASRRNNIAERLRSADPSARPGFEARLQALDTRILRIENDLTDAVGLMKGVPAAALIAGTEVDPSPAVIVGRIANEAGPLIAVASLLLLAPLVFAVVRLFWKRASTSARPVLSDHAATQRFDQLQQAVDTIAIEVERISEGQRFVTKLLNEKDRELVARAANRLEG